MARLVLSFGEAMREQWKEEDRYFRVENSTRSHDVGVPTDLGVKFKSPTVTRM